MVAAGSQMAGTITIDGTSYSITRRTGDNQVFGSFTVPTSKKAIFYALAVSSGGGDRQINLICGEEKHEFTVPGGSGAYQRIESEELPAGTYSIEREGSSNVRMGIVVLKFVNAGGPGMGIEGVQSTDSRTQKIIREGQLLILRDGKIYTVTGQSL
jgi:hypothetical protein